MLIYPRERIKYSENDKRKFKNTRIGPIEKNNEPSCVTYKTEHSKDMMTIGNPMI